MAHLDILSRDPDPDALATRLGYLGWLGRKGMAPSFDKGLLPLVAGTGNEPLGRLIPGKGVYVDYDLKKLGINRPIPGVYERTPLRRLWERLLGDETGAITTYDGIINARAGGKADDVMISLNSITVASGFWYDLWTAGGNPAAGTYLNTTAPTDQVDSASTTGSWAQWLTSPTGSDKKYLIAMGWGSTIAHNYAMLADSLTHGGAFRTTVTTAETIVSPHAVTRQYGSTSNLGTGAQLIGVVTTARTTPTTSNVTLGYNDATGNASHTSAVAMLANADPVNRCLALPNQGTPFATLASGDVGVRQINSAQKAAAADAAGKFALRIVQPLMIVPGIAANVWVERDAPMNIDGLVQLVDVSGTLGGLTLLLYAASTTSGVVLSQLRCCAG